MSYYSDVYLKRLNRYGNDYQSRVQGAREHSFELYLEKSVYRVDFTYNDVSYAGSLERKSQDETEILQYLLVDVDLNIPNGTVLQLKDKDGVNTPWMIYYLDDIKASGYNRYIVLKMTHNLSWTARDKSSQTSYAYMYGQENNMLKDELKSRSRMDTLYTENLKSSFFIMPRTQYLKKDDYLIIGTSPYQEYYKVTGYDIQSTPGVEFVTVDPVYEYDQTAAPEQEEGEPDTDFFWFEGV